MEAIQKWQRERSMNCGWTGRLGPSLRWAVGRVSREVIALGLFLLNELCRFLVKLTLS